MGYIKKFNEENIGKTQTEADIELSLIKFFEHLSEKYPQIHKQWAIDRFNEKETEIFIDYMKNKLK